LKPWNEEQAMDHQWRDFTRSAENPATTARSINNGSKTRHKDVLAAYRHLIAKEPGFEAQDRKPELARTLPTKEDEHVWPVFVFAADPCCFIGLDGGFRRLNPAWRRALGWADEDVNARPFLDLVHPDDRTAVAAELAKIAGGGATSELEIRLCDKDGADRRLQWRAIGWPERGAVCVTAREVDGRQHRERERLEAGDRERERLGRELHDGLCQNLAGIAALSATLARKLAARDDPSLAAAAEITALLQQAIGDARDLARGLSAGGLAQMGLAAALEALAANVEALHPVRCAFACDRHFPRLDPAVEAHLYRIAQEAVSNAVAHGRGSRISVSLRLGDGEASLRIRDNGVGIPRGAAGVAGMGLDTMDYRARLILARLQVRRTAPRGTLVACTFPVTPPAAKERRHAGNAP
jgi:PAS domain S-box-containing protein